MPTRAKRYAYGVIAAGGLVCAVAVWNWASPNPLHFIIYFTLALIASMLKVRLPRITGTYSVSFLFTLVGIVEFTLPETLVASCAGALVQSLWKSKQRPSMIQILFNMANLCLSISLCYLVAHVGLVQGLAVYRPAVLALIAALHFFISTMLLSGVLSLLQGKPLRQVCEQWYMWFLPYYLIGAALVGLLPLSGRSPAPEGWMILLPLLYLVHFFYVVSTDRVPVGAASREHRDSTMTFGTRLYLSAVIGAAAVLLAYGAFHWQPQNLDRFLGYLAMALVAAALKVRLPGLTSTISLSFVVFLLAVAELSYVESIVIAAAATAVQTIWKAQRTPRLVQIAFNSACMVVSVSAAYAVCHGFLESTLASSIPALLVVATIVLYSSNTIIIAGIMCLAERKPLSALWQQCYFWSFPYYLVGASASALMITAAESVIWGLSIAVFPILTLVYVSYRIHATAKVAPELML
ncbi:MAG TPA: hypothetical protein VNH18_30670 [Bryobacteraceae bacterium]|jgi:hypothetical protein|nr:hypothetical protein [Bryobacteraceae bacterium]HXJ43687.1 hypothetical protein [Bryobacteraceae bacterium]